MSNLHEYKLVTPALAAELLKANHSNRRLDKNRVSVFVRHLTGGTFMSNGEPIKFSKSGRLLDGQHRLWAIVNSNVSAFLDIRYGLDDDAMATIDTPKPRSASDILQLLGYTNTAKLVSVINWIRTIDSADGKKQANSLRRGGILTAIEQRNWIEQNPEIAASMREGAHAYDKFRALNVSIITAIHYLGSQIDPVAAQQFVDGCATGANLMQGDPRLTLRQRMVDRSIRIRKEPIEHVAAFHVYAWNAFREGRQLKRLQYRDFDAMPMMK